MSDRALRVIASTIASIGLACVVATIALIGRTDGPGAAVGEAFLDLALVAFVLVGLVIVVRRPAERIGWLSLLVGTSIAAGAAVAAYVDLHSHDPSSLPGGPWLALVPNWLMAPGMVVGLVLLPLLFPTGLPPSPRWRWVQHLGVGSAVVLALFGLLGEDGALVVMDGVVWGPNPFAGLPGKPVVEVLALVAFGGAFLLLPFSMASLLVRYRRSTGVERLQLRWFRMAIGLLTAAVAVLFASVALGLDGPVVEAVVEGILGLSITVIPVSIGIAVLRYRLYDIDRLANRALVYAAVSAVLVAGYAVLVVGFQTVLRPVTGSSDLAVAGSTLAVAAAFGPVRRRVQSGVDRRFSRERYDAQRAVEGFGRRVRDEVDLEQLTLELRALVGTTVRPARVTLWMAEDPPT
jgi:uncharacterized membrane protein YidH (DUF202 family)